MLADLILMAPPADQAMLLAAVVANLGGMVLEKNQEADPNSPRRSSVTKSDGRKSSGSPRSVPLPRRPLSMSNELLLLDAEPLGGLEIDHQLEFGRLHAIRGVAMMRLGNHITLALWCRRTNVKM